MSSSRASKTSELAGPAAGAVIGLAIFLWSFLIRDVSGATYGPRFWPQMIGVLLFAFNGWAIVRALAGVTEEPEGPAEGATSIDLNAVGARHWLTALLVVSFPLVVHLMGFLMGSAVFLAAFMLGLGYRRLSVVVTTALVFSVSLTWFFTAGVFTPLPPGKGPFYAVSSEFARLISGRS